MNTKILACGFLAFALSISSLSAGEFDLRTNMFKLNAELNELQRGFISSDKKSISIILDSFAKDAEDLLSNKESMMNMLPKDMDSKKHKVNIAAESARKIKVEVQTIREAIENKNNLSVKKRQIIAQEAYLNIIGACFHCHNLVRDKELITE
ncbi:hypothetical protein KKG72_05480 [bacterium]|nr:hypothetical protein [bacterium]MBU1993551.1 hypothetical protein [bacterium]